MAESVVLTAAKDKSKKFAQSAAALMTTAMMMVQYPYAFFAGGTGTGGGTNNDFSVSVNTQGMENQFSDPSAVMGMVIGLAIWVCRITGVGLFIWGIYGYVTARKDGEAEAMNGALGKLVAGAVLIGMKGILHAMNIVN